MGQRSLTCKGGDQTVRSDRDCQHQGGRELGFDGMANSSEPLINVVKDRRAKGAERLEPKGTWPGVESVPFSLADKTATGGQAEPTPSRYLCGTWQPRRPLPRRKVSREAS